MSWLIFCLSLLSTPQPATAPAAADAADRPTVIVVVGAEGEPEFGREFAKWADRWAEAAGRASAELIVVGRGEASASSTDKQRLQSLLDAQSKSPAPSRPLWLVLIGHGTHDGKEAKFNLRGPDVSDAELADWLKPCRRPLAVIDCSSSSAPFLNRLSGKDRVVITATRTGSETNFARFGDFFSASIADPAADLDKDGQTSLLEAFIAASHRVEEFYKQAGRLPTEHALLDDNGDALGVAANWFQGTRATRAAKNGAPIDGPRANQWHLLLSPAEQAMPAKVRAKRDALELKVETLRGKKASMPEAEYYAQLEALLVELAHVYEPQPAPASQPRRGEKP
jgi:hypothetical protein